jgi:glycolate oxidase iron-sulfur subunit
VYLMRGVAEGAIPLGDVFAEEMSLCLGCRACETACPSGVEYGTLLERGRALVADAGLRRGLPAWIERFALRHVVPRRARLHALVSCFGLVQRLGLDRALRPLLPTRLRDAQALLPEVPTGGDRTRLAGSIVAQGERRGTVALFEGCIMPELFGGVNRATVQVLVANGFDVVVPAEQGCCGALQAHAGDPATARVLARANASAFALHVFDALIVNSAGCGAAMRECGGWVPGQCDALAASTRDVCEWLDDAGLRMPLGSLAHADGSALRVCYDDPCHLLHAQGVGSAPRRLLGAIPGLELVAHAEADACCGAAGTYNLTQPEMSAAVLARKMDALASADPDVIATGNPGCLMQLRAGVSQRGLRAQVLHPVELLARAYAAPRPPAGVAQSS